MGVGFRGLAVKYDVPKCLRMHLLTLLLFCPPMPGPAAAGQGKRSAELAAAKGSSLPVLARNPNPNSVTKNSEQ